VKTALTYTFHRRLSVADKSRNGTGLTIHIAGSVAEHKAEMISSRTKAALVAAMARGVKLDGDKGKTRCKAMLGAKARALGTQSQSAEAEQ
jgi:DNA invertase Pin-like site-specific DNA recombinase